MNHLSRTHTVAAAGANIFDAVAVGIAGPCRLACGVSCASASRCVAVLHAVHLNVLPTLLQNELAQRVGRLRDAPPDARVVAYFQVTGFGSFLESLVMIRSAPTAILYAVL